MHVSVMCLSLFAHWAVLCPVVCRQRVLQGLPRRPQRNILRRKGTTHPPMHAHHTEAHAVSLRVLIYSFLSFFLPFPIGQVDEDSKRLVKTTYESLMEAIKTGIDGFVAVHFGAVVFPLRVVCSFWKFWPGCLFSSSVITVVCFGLYNHVPAVIVVCLSLPLFSSSRRDVS